MPATRPSQTCALRVPSASSMPPASPSRSAHAQSRKPAPRRRRPRGINHLVAGRRSFVLVALALYAACALWATWPAIRHVDDHYLARPAAGHGEAAAGDHLQLGWSFWLVGHQLGDGRSPFSDPYSFRPESEAPPNLQGWLLGLPYWPLRAAFGDVWAYDLLVLLAFVAAGCLACWWLRALGLSRGASLLGGLVFCLMPYRVGQSTGHLLGLVSVLLPATLLALERRRLVLAGGMPRRAAALRAAPPRPGRGPARARLRVGAAPAVGVVEGGRRGDGCPRRGPGGRPLGDLRVDRNGPVVRAGRPVLRGAFRLRAPLGRIGRGGARLHRLADAGPRRRRARRDPQASRAGARARPRRARPVPSRARREPPRLRGGLAHRARPRGDARPRAPDADRVPRDRRARGLRDRRGTSPARDHRSRAVLGVAGVGILAVLAVVLALDLRVPVFGAVAADTPNTAYAAMRGPGRLLELPVFRPDIHFGSAYLGYARQSPRERPQGYSTVAPRAATRLARELRGLSCGRGAIPTGLGVRYVAVHRGLYAQSGFFDASCPRARRGRLAPRRLAAARARRPDRHVRTGMSRGAAQGGPSAFHADTSRRTSAGNDRRRVRTTGGASRPTIASISRCERPSRARRSTTTLEVEVLRRARRHLHDAPLPVGL